MACRAFLLTQIGQKGTVGCLLALRSHQLDTRVPDTRRRSRTAPGPRIALIIGDNRHSRFRSGRAPPQAPTPRRRYRPSAIDRPRPIHNADSRDRPSFPRLCGARRRTRSSGKFTLGPDRIISEGRNGDVERAEQRGAIFLPPYGAAKRGWPGAAARPRAAFTSSSASAMRALAAATSWLSVSANCSMRSTGSWAGLPKAAHQSPSIFLSSSDRDWLVRRRRGVALGRIAGRAPPGRLRRLEIRGRLCRRTKVQAEPRRQEPKCGGSFPAPPGGCRLPALTLRLDQQQEWNGGKRQHHHQLEIVDIGDHRGLVGDHGIKPGQPLQRDPWHGYGRRGRRGWPSRVIRRFRCLADERAACRRWVFWVKRNITTEMPIELPTLRSRLKIAVPSLRKMAGKVVKATGTAAHRPGRHQDLARCRM